MTLKSLLLPAFAAAALSNALSGAPAMADQAQSRTVTIDRATLSTQAGAAHAYAAIETAARAACRAENRGGAAFDRSVRLCTADTVARAVTALDAPRLTALHQNQERAVTLALLD